MQLGVKNLLVVDKKKRCNFKDKSLGSFRLWEAAVRGKQTARPALQNRGASTRKAAEMSNALTDPPHSPSSHPRSPPLLPIPLPSRGPSHHNSSQEPGPPPNHPEHPFRAGRRPSHLVLPCR